MATDESFTTFPTTTGVEPTQPSIAVSCDDLQCPQNTPFCQLNVIPSLNTSFATCETEESLKAFENQARENPGEPCSARSCLANEVCVDYSGQNIDSGGYCSAMNCDRAGNSSCPEGEKCVDVPSGYKTMLGDTHCIPSTVFVNYNVSCGSPNAPNCDFGTYCADVRLGDIPIGSYCSPVVSAVRTCDQIECQDTFECIESSFDIQPLQKISSCVFIPAPPIDQSTEPPIFPTTDERPTLFPEPTGPTTSIALSCEALNCPSTAPICQMSRIPDLNLTVATCALPDTQNVLSSTNRSCEAITCTEGQICIDTYGENRLTEGFCSTVDCSSGNISCPFDTKCIDVPSNIRGIPVDSSCVPEDVEFNFGVSCESESAPKCDEGEMCANSRTEEIMLGSFCSATTPVSTTRGCEELECPVDMLCTEITFKDVEDFRFTTCFSTNATLPLLQALGGCDVLECGENERCFTDQATGLSACVPNIQIGRTCSEITCPIYSPCAVFTIPSDPTSSPIATCYFNITASLEGIKSFSCDNYGSILCSDNCLSGFQSDRTSGIYCSGCDVFDECRFGQTCEELPQALASMTGINATCASTQMEFGVDCKSKKDPCIGPMYCEEIIFEDTLVGSSCSTTGFQESCDQVNCNSMEICSEIRQNGVQIATCIGRDLLRFQL